MVLTLSDGSIIHFDVQHRTKSDGRRYTKVWLYDVASMREYEAESVCSKDDNFCKRTGRKLAAQRLLENLRTWDFPKDDRRLIFCEVCPEYGPA